MAWENIITGYKIQFVLVDAVLPIGSVFISEGRRRLYSISGEPVYEIGFYFQVPVYKKQNIKRK